jgi:hypothetical protein
VDRLLARLVADHPDLDREWLTEACVKAVKIAAGSDPHPIAERILSARGKFASRVLGEASGRITRKTPRLTVKTARVKAMAKSRARKKPGIGGSAIHGFFRGAKEELRAAAMDRLGKIIARIAGVTIPSAPATKGKKP